METLTNLQGLNLEGNKIEEVKGLEKLVNLKRLNLDANPIRRTEQRVIYSWVERKCTRWSKIMGREITEYEYPTIEDMKDIQGIVRYCQDKAEGKFAFVTVGRTKYYVINGILDLSKSESSKLNIRDISEIEGLDHLTNLQELDLSWNRIKEIKGLETLTNLRGLNLEGNKIEEVKGLENLVNLQRLDLSINPIKEDERHLLWRNAQEVVKYCQEKARKAKEGNSL